MARQLIFALSEKFNALREWAKTHAPELSTMHGLAKATGADRTDLRNDIEDGRLTILQQDRLAKAFGFDRSWPEWHGKFDGRAAQTNADPKVAAAEIFFNRFLREKQGISHRTVFAHPTTAHLDSRFANFSFNVAGSYVGDGTVNSIPLVLALSFDRRGWSVLIDGTTEISVGLKQVDMQLSYARAGAKIEINEIQCRQGEGNFIANARGLSAWWVVTLANDQKDGWLSDTRRPNDGKDCLLEGFECDDEILATMSARVSDCFVEIHGEAFDKHSINKQRFIEHLIKLEVLRGAEATLCEQRLVVVGRGPEV